MYVRSFIKIDSVFQKFLGGMHIERDRQKSDVISILYFINEERRLKTGLHSFNISFRMFQEVNASAKQKILKKICEYAGKS